MKSWTLSILLRLCRSLAVIAIVTIFTPVAALADQFPKAANNSTIDGYVSANEISRISLIGDGVASIQKIKSVDFTQGFSLAHDALTGDIYLTLPSGYQSKFVNFFVTSKRGYTYKFLLAVRETPGTQIFVRNPLVSARKADPWERATPFRQTAIRLIQAMWGGATVAGYSVERKRSEKQKAGPLRIVETARYQGAALTGLVIQVRNASHTSVRLLEERFAVPGTVAIAIDRAMLEPKETATVFMVSRKAARDD